MMGKLFALEAMPLNIDRIRTRLWNKIRTGSCGGESSPGGAFRQGSRFYSAGAWGETIHMLQGILYNRLSTVLPTRRSSPR